MLVEALASHLERPVGRGHTPEDSFIGAAGGAVCGDLIRISLAIDPHSPEGVVQDAGFEASGCGASIAAGSATVEMVRGAPLLRAARVGAEEIARELGGLSLAKRHAAELASDALHRALGCAARGRAALAPAKRRTLVAMSGGVDSAVAALLVREDEDEAVGVTLELWSDPENDGERSCCSAQAVRAAREVAHGLGLAHLSIDLRAESRRGVVDRWLSDHAAGLTPNPCVRCNGSVRLDAMLDLGQRLGARTLATGHYARVEHDGDPRGPLLRVAADAGKDQSYALAALAPASLARMRFPLGDLHKSNVRERAEHAGLAVAGKPDSQDLCFLAGTRQADFLARHGGLEGRPGRIVDREGRQLGAHGGVQGFTVGQRHGLGIGGSQPLYVLASNARANTITVGSRTDLLTRTLRVRDATIHRDCACVDAVKVRYRGRRMACRVAGNLAAGGHRRMEVELEAPMERTAPGQMACLYAGDVIVGHGTIAA